MNEALEMMLESDQSLDFSHCIIIEKQVKLIFCWKEWLIPFCKMRAKLDRKRRQEDSGSTKKQCMMRKMKNASYTNEVLKKTIIVCQS